MTTPFPETPTPSAPPIAPPTATPTAETVLPVKDSNFRYKATPSYPDVQMQEGVEGTVIVLVTIGPDGSLLDATIDQSSGNAALDAAALAAAHASLYTAPLRDGKPVTAEYRIVYEFKID